MLCLMFLACVAIATEIGFADELTNARKPANDADLQYWLQNMVWHHRFTNDEVRAATGLTEAEIVDAKNRFGIQLDSRPKRELDAPLLVLPYPGGRHPRIGFLDGAIDPQRETKVSVFSPWDADSYVVVDVPEAIWSNLGLTYLAHTHVPTIWSKQKIDLPRLEWTRRQDGSYELRRELPNKIAFTAMVVPGRDGVRMKLTLVNGTAETLTDLRVQNCVMLRGASGFDQQSNDNKVFQSPYVACRNEAGDHWIITAWEPCHRPWANPPCPCLHSDPKFPDCPAGETRTLTGWLSFYEGRDLPAELKRLDGVRQASVK
jgi:hypothetical protein